MLIQQALNQWSHSPSLCFCCCCWWGWWQQQWQDDDDIPTTQLHYTQELFANYLYYLFCFKFWLYFVFWGLDTSSLAWLQGKLVTKWSPHPFSSVTPSAVSRRTAFCLLWIELLSSTCLLLLVVVVLAICFCLFVCSFVCLSLSPPCLLCIKTSMITLNISGPFVVSIPSQDF